MKRLVAKNISYVLCDRYVTLHGYKNRSCKNGKNWFGWTFCQIPPYRDSKICDIDIEHVIGEWDDDVGAGYFVKGDMRCPDDKKSKLKTLL